MSDGTIKPTDQAQLEASDMLNGKKRRQSTRYSVHGLHEYKGKFNPQVVRGVLNILGVSERSLLLDPFCGSGTSLVEAAHMGITSIGVDLNPLAVYITNAKLQALASVPSDLQVEFAEICASVETEVADFCYVEDGFGRYLSRWFPDEVLAYIETLRSVVREKSTITGQIHLAIASSLLRDYSFQEPTDLRIRRRKSDLPVVPFPKAFSIAAKRFFESLSRAQSIVGRNSLESQAFVLDNGNLGTNEHTKNLRFNAVITSPPYATALPYIDTYRLSLVWLRLVSAGELGGLEASVTGSREFRGGERKDWQTTLSENRLNLPGKLWETCMHLQNSLGEIDGFRRRDVPILLYRYLAHMKDAFAAVRAVTQVGAPFALIVGSNHSSIGGARKEIDTPQLLLGLANETGWEIQTQVALEVYQRYGIHSANSVQSESLIVLRRK